jgi:hypothetical protein
LYEGANAMLTRFKGPLKLKDWAFAIAKRSTMRKARIALAPHRPNVAHGLRLLSADSIRSWATVEPVRSTMSCLGRGNSPH